ncbi:MAG: TIGR03364 family FAD-dependent oxidoreductase [Blastocatellales bacterium]|nr:TIGR03364 family FAD-dependent oxidoreductase [Blastocatellales bacterium]
MQEYDDAIVGAGIMGLAHAYALARRGRSVVVFERQSRAQGASVRNFGMLWPIGQPKGLPRQVAMQSRGIWLDVLRESGLWHEQTGSLHLAYREDEEAVLREFLDAAPRDGYECEWLAPHRVLDCAPLVNPENLRGALWSPSEICIDPRQVVAALPDWLERNYGVRFEFNCAATAYDRPTVTAGGREWTAGNLYVCSGEDFQTLYPDAFRESGLYRVKLQMMRSQAYGESVRIGPMLAAGLTLCHYRNFQDCPSLPALRERFSTEMPDYVRYGIHVMASQHASGEVTIGDSHEYDSAITPFDREEINELILGYLRTFLLLPDLRIAERWQGVYAAHPAELCWTARPAAGAMIAASPSGRGMTMSFGIAERIVAENLEETGGEGG